MTPVSAFITFENEEGFVRAKIAHQHGVTLLGDRVKIEQAPEPTNIIWENREITAFSRFLRGLFAVVILGILLALSFYIVIKLKTAAKEADDKYQRGNCKEINQIYGPDLLKEYAF